MEATSLTMTVGPARSVALRDGNGTRIRVRKFPTDRLTGDRVRVVEMPEEPTLDEDLFGPVLARESYELYVLWSPHVASSTLDAVFLAAVSDIDSASRVRVHAAVQLPPPSALPRSTAVPTTPRIGPPLGFAAGRRLRGAHPRGRRGRHQHLVVGLRSACWPGQSRDFGLKWGALCP